MKKINILRKAGFLLFFFFFSHLAMAQAVGDFRSIGNGNWTATATWQTWNGSTWVTPTPSNYPGNPGGSYTVTVSTGTTVTVNPTLTVTIGDLYVLGNLQVQKDFNINTNTPIPNLYINNGTILMSSHMGLYLPSGSNIGMNISDPKTQGFQETGGCNGDTGVYIGKKKFSMCQGNSGIGDFQTLNELASSGIAVANATPSEVCLGSSVLLQGSKIGNASVTEVTWTRLSTPSNNTPTIVGTNGSTTPYSVSSGVLNEVGNYVFEFSFKVGGSAIFNDQVTVTVKPNMSVSSASSSPTLCVNTALTPITHTTTGATGIGTATNLPAGVSASWSGNTITISGTPTASGTFNYNIPLSGGCGVASAKGTITVTANNSVALTSAAGTNNQTQCINTVITPITYATTGATGATLSGLPSGVSGNWASNTVTISGTPTVSGSFPYTVTLTGGCGVITATGTITVTANNTVALTSAAGTNGQTKCISTAITPITYATTGATGAIVTGLPAGVTGNWASNVITISGTPTASGTFNYTVTLTGGCGAITSTGTITVTANNTVILTSAAGTNNQSKCINTAITPITYAATGATGATFSGLPAGV
ncbi:MAG: hypothetical protein KJ689_08725, partial [Bacteroidetes bacterium]|nr:hypothetical protein [Bacteroidota bacterium]